MRYTNLSKSLRVSPVTKLPVGWPLPSRPTPTTPTTTKEGGK